MPLSSFTLSARSAAAARLARRLACGAWLTAVLACSSAPPMRPRVVGNPSQLTGESECVGELCFSYVSEAEPEVETATHAAQE
jgi:hypothetical protein